MGSDDRAIRSWAASSSKIKLDWRIAAKPVQDHTTGPSSVFVDARMQHPSIQDVMHALLSLRDWRFADEGSKCISFRSSAQNHYTIDLALYSALRVLRRKTKK